MATILVILLRVNWPNFVHFRTVNAQKPSPKGEAAAWSAYSWIRAWRCGQKFSSFGHVTENGRVDISWFSEFASIIHTNMRQ